MSGGGGGAVPGELDDELGDDAGDEERWLGVACEGSRDG